jgi:sugar O-acyltransferase (sialic acid O-acetyltransferase NeuD family)
MQILRVPQINANEEEVEVVDVVAEEGQEIEEGAIICVLESTKATMEVEASQAGFVRRLEIEEGDRVGVGEVLCVITEGADDPVELGEEEQKKRRHDGIRATRKAAALIDEYDIEPEEIVHEGILTERDVLQFMQRDRGDLRSPKDQPAHQQAAIIDNSSAGLVIYGAGGHARVIIDLIREGRRDLNIVGIVDDSPERPDQVMGVPVLGDVNQLANLRDRGVEMAALGIGAVTHNALRAELFERLRYQQFRLPNLIHPRAVVEPSVRMGQGNQIFGGAVVSSNVELADNTIINSNAVISHDCRIGAHAHITPGALLAGGVVVGERSVIGMAATIFLGVDIGVDVVVSNGQDVVGDVGDGEVVR